MGVFFEQLIKIFLENIKIIKKPAKQALNRVLRHYLQVI